VTASAGRTGADALILTGIVAGVLMTPIRTGVIDTKRV